MADIEEIEIDDAPGNYEPDQTEKRQQMVSSKRQGTLDITIEAEAITEELLDQAYDLNREQLEKRLPSQKAEIADISKRGIEDEIILGLVRPLINLSIQYLGLEVTRNIINAGLAVKLVGKLRKIWKLWRLPREVKTVGSNSDNRGSGLGEDDISIELDGDGETPGQEGSADTP